MRFGHLVIAFREEDADTARATFAALGILSHPRQRRSLVTSGWSAEMAPEEAEGLRRKGLCCRLVIR